MDVIVGAEDVKAEKPSPEGLLLHMPWSSWGGPEGSPFIQGTAWWTQRQRRSRCGFCRRIDRNNVIQIFEPFNHICIVRDLAELMNALTQEKWEKHIIGEQIKGGCPHPGGHPPFQPHSAAL